MEITLDALKLGKQTIIKEKTYLSTWEYVEPFINELSKYTKKFVVQVQLPKQFTISDSGEDITYNKVWIQAILPNNDVYGLIYTLDSKVPVYKIYRAVIDPETKYTLIFNPDWIQIHEIKPECKFSFSISNLMSMVSDSELKQKILKDTYIEKEDVHKLLGESINKVILYTYESVGGKVKLAANDVLKAYQNVFNGVNIRPTLYDFYEAILAEVNNDKDFNVLEKTLLTGMIFDLVDNENNN